MKYDDHMNGISFQNTYINIYLCYIFSEEDSIGEFNSSLD